MKHINFFMILTVVFAVVAIVFGALYFVGEKKEKNVEPEIDKPDILSCTDKGSVKKYIETNNIQEYSMQDDACNIYGTQVFETNANVEISFDGESVAQIKASYTLFECIDENASEEELKNIDLTKYVFSSDDRNKINEACENIKTQLENRLGCEKIEQYDFIAISDKEKSGNDEEDFFDGSFMKEYSVRDSNGVLWLLDFEASYGKTYATLFKIVDDKDYEGFIPIKNMIEE